MHLEHVLRQIQPDCANFRHGRLRQVMINDTTLAQRCRKGASTPSTSDHTRAQASVVQLKPLALGLCIFRPTVPTSIPSRTPSPNSSLSCARPLSEPSKACGPGSANSSLPSPQTNAKTTSPPLDIRQRKWIPL